MRRMVIGICDDDYIWMKHASKVLKEYFQLRDEKTEIVCFEDGNQILAYKGEPLHVIFMDIELDDYKKKHEKQYAGQNRVLTKRERTEAAGKAKLMELERTEEVAKGIVTQENGIDLTRRVNELWPDCQIVYCTNYLHYALDVYETNHVYYIVKTQFEERLDQVFEKIRFTKKYEKNQVCFHVINRGMTCFLLKDILYFERVTRYTEIHTAEGCYDIREKILEIWDLVPNGIFTRCHASYLVNMGQISYKSGKIYQLKSGEIIPISRGFSKMTREDFLLWCTKQMGG